MGVEFKEIGQKVVISRAIYFAGEKVGYVDSSDFEKTGSRYHAVLKIKQSASGFNCGMAQGHGETEIAAIEDAFINGETEAKAYIAELERLAALYLAATAKEAK